MKRGIAYYDGACRFCVKTRRILEALDVLGAVTWQDFRSVTLPAEVDLARCEQSVQIVIPGRSSPLGGFHAFRWLAARIPVFWPIVGLLWLPGISFLGDRLYQIIAKRRSGTPQVACEATTSDEARPLD